ncbi:type II secretion system F family protein [bacterium CPR1]|nr:type II secretion system F family protein [bacterium CPR1]
MPRTGASPPDSRPDSRPGSWSERLSRATRFKYRVRDGDGRLQEGFLTAPSIERARNSLMARYPALLEVSAAAAPRERVQTIRVPGDRVVVFYRRLATMLAAGVTVQRALDFLQRSEEDPRLAEVLEDLVQALNSGRTLSHIMGADYLSNVFHPTAVGLVAMGEQTGSLFEAVGKLADLTEVQLRQRRAVVSAMTYPSVLLLVILAVAVLFVLILGPRDSGLFSLFGGELPWPTRVMVAASGVLRSPWILLVAAGVIGLAVAWLGKLVQQIPQLRMAVHAKILELPLIGPLVEKTLTARMLYVLCCAVQVGIPMMRALAMAREVCTNDALGKNFDRAVQAFRQGDDLALALERYGVFPPLVTSMIHIGTETANLDAILLRVSRSYEEEVETALNNATRLAEPILLCFAGALSAFMALATLLPVVEVINRL